MSGLLGGNEPPDSLNAKYSVQTEEDEEYRDDMEEAPGPSSTESDFVPDNATLKEPHLLTQSELNDFIRDLELPKNEAELLRQRKGFP
ncbi:hypothetical protein ANN_21070 [Periplaneta americana]|uniref:Uncharacterized protein n=1 Tax=Periplaneta americana TaxID=6978 RepID=A0ABQ8SF82_PERAM|nr:hypothetical protein ANN_21070 [Periplaneta americana]